jgi:hypothetical protein
VHVISCGGGGGCGEDCTVVVDDVFDVPHDFGIAALGPRGGGFYGFAFGFEDGGGLGVQHEGDG